jgi:hypothetical protein
MLAQPVALWPLSGFSAGFDAVVSRAMLPLGTLPNENNNTLPSRV